MRGHPIELSSSFSPKAAAARRFLAQISSALFDAVSLKDSLTGSKGCQTTRKARDSAVIHPLRTATSSYLAVPSFRLAIVLADHYHGYTRIMRLNNIRRRDLHLPYCIFHREDNLCREVPGSRMCSHHKLRTLWLSGISYI